MKIYLDQKDWINLARAYYDRPDGQRYKAILQKILETVENKKTIFPLSFTHVIETNKRGNLESKKRLASFMAEISQGNTIAPQFQMALSELNYAIAQKYKSKTPKIHSAFGLGIPFAFGMELVIKDKNNTVVKPTNEMKHIIRDMLTSKKISTQILVGNDFKLVDAIKFLTESRQKYVKAAEGFRQKTRSHLKNG